MSFSTHQRSLPTSHLLDRNMCPNDKRRPLGSYLSRTKNNSVHSRKSEVFTKQWIKNKSLTTIAILDLHFSDRKIRKHCRKFYTTNTTIRQQQKVDRKKETQPTQNTMWGWDGVVRVEKMSSKFAFVGSLQQLSLKNATCESWKVNRKCVRWQ